MDKITKFLRHLTPKEREKLEEVISNIIADNVANYDRKKLKGHSNLYRIRVNDLRVVYIDLDDGKNIILIERRSESTYKNF